MSVTSSLRVNRALKASVSRHRGAVAGVVAKIVLDEAVVMEQLGMKGKKYEDVVRELGENPALMNSVSFRDRLLVLLMHEAGLIG